MNTTEATEIRTTDADLLVRKSVFVKAPPQRAFDVFTKQMGAWWPLGSHHAGAVEAKDISIDPRVGGNVSEVGVDGSTCAWGHVLEWNPPTRFAFRWELDAAFKVDPKIDTRVEVTFTAESGGTRVDLVHSGLRAYGDKAEEMAAIFRSQGGWTGLMGAFAAYAA